MANPYFKFNGKCVEEYNLYNQMVDEVIEMGGAEFKFLPRTLQKADLVLGEDPQSAFNESYDLTMLIDNYSSFEGGGEFFSKFGFQVDDQLVLIIQKDRFFTETGLSAPLESDLIYYPIANMIFEINHVDEKAEFYQFGGQMSFKIKATLYEYSGENMQTGIDAVDALESVDSADTDEEFYSVEGEFDEIIDNTESGIFNKFI